MLKGEIESRSALVSAEPSASVANEQAAGSTRDAMSATMLTAIFAATGKRILAREQLKPV